MTKQQVQEDMAAVEGALHTLVSTMVRHDILRMLDRIPVTTFELVAFEKLDPARAFWREQVTHPVRFALREGVKRLGRDVHRLGGGTGGMLDVLWKVAEMDSTHAGRRAVIMDSAWNGIGEGNDRWWS